MSFRFWRRIRLAPWVTLNLSKSAASLSFGPRGAKYTVSPRGNRATVGLPGTGLFYTVRHGRPAARAEPDRLELGFFQRLTLPADERGFVDALRALNEGAMDQALRGFESAAASLPDAAWAAGMIHLSRDDFAPARAQLEAALRGRDRLGAVFAKYDVTPRIGLPVTPEVTAHIEPRERGTRLALVEIAQLTGDRAGALAQVERLLALDPADPVVLVSFAELALDVPDDRAGLERLLALTAGLGNDCAVHTAVLLHRGEALARLGMHTAAREIFTQALRRRAGRSPELLRAIRHARALAYEAEGRMAQARRDFEAVYAEAPDTPGVAERLGLGR